MKAHTLLTLALLTVFGVAPVMADAVVTISPKGHQAIKAKVINPDPKTFTINVRMLANLGVDEEAPTFALYISSSLPKQCADFRSSTIHYTKPKKYHRQFDLSKKTNVLTALDQYKCVVIRNIKPTAI